MKKIIIVFTILIIVIVGLAVYVIYLEKKNPTPQKQQENIDLIKQELNQTLQDNEIQVANPSSVYCIEQGGKLEARTDENGEVAGYCVFENGLSCEEWAFFRGECQNNQ